MTLPKYFGSRGRDTTRETALVQQITAAIATLQTLDELKHTDLVGKLDDQGLMTAWDRLPVRTLESLLTTVQAALSTAGGTHSGVRFTDPSADYIAKRGELILVAADSVQIILPRANDLTNEGHTVMVKTVEASSITVVDAGDAEIDFSAVFAPVAVAGANYVFKHVTGPAEAQLHYRGGAKIDLAGLLAGETVTINAVVYTEGVDFTNAATLAAAINLAEPTLEATAAGTVVTVQCRRPGRSDTQLLADFGALADTVTGAAWTRVDGVALSPAAQFNVAGSDQALYNAFARGGASISLENSVVGRTVTIGVTVFTHVAGVPVGNQYRTAAELVTAINAALGGFDPEARGNKLVLQSAVVGRDNVDLAALGALSTTIPSTSWTRVDGAALSPAAQLNVEGSERGGYYVVI